MVPITARSDLSGCTFSAHSHYYLPCCFGISVLQGVMLTLHASHTLMATRGFIYAGLWSRGLMNHAKTNPTIIGIIAIMKLPWNQKASWACDVFHGISVFSVLLKILFLPLDFIEIQVFNSGLRIVEPISISPANFLPSVRWTITTIAVFASLHYNWIVS